eukprot:TRINITY_DN6021_c0_g1_i1.p1 TRINITY_DN6021_c0_g1~~TRINITY_DN6021_c0_g1_i1.p1  ORF type:complete len:459 (-),score=74.03 TRINITY_DN6021_c0_g1_i1:154-1467(-)
MAARAASPFGPSTGQQMGKPATAARDEIDAGGRRPDTNLPKQDLNSSTVSTEATAGIGVLPEFAANSRVASAMSGLAIGDGDGCISRDTYTVGTGSEVEAAGSGAWASRVAAVLSQEIVAEMGAARIRAAEHLCSSAEVRISSEEAQVFFEAARVATSRRDVPMFVAEQAVGLAASGLANRASPGSAASTVSAQYLPTRSEAGQEDPELTVSRELAESFMAGLSDWTIEALVDEAKAQISKERSNRPYGRCQSMAFAEAGSSRSPSEQSSVPLAADQGHSSSAELPRPYSESHCPSVAESVSSGSTPAIANGRGTHGPRGASMRTIQEEEEALREVSFEAVQNVAETLGMGAEEMVSSGWCQVGLVTSTTALPESDSSGKDVSREDGRKSSKDSSGNGCYSVFSMATTAPPNSADSDNHFKQISQEISQEALPAQGL